MLLSRRDGGAEAPHHPWLDQTARPRTLLVLAALVLAAAAMFFTGSAVRGTPAAKAAAGPVGNDFVVTAGDLTFILKQIRIAERHAATATAAVPCDTMVGPADDQIPDRLTSYGLRLVDGSCNNLFPGRSNFAAADVAFPRLTGKFARNGEAAPPGFPASPTGEGTGYSQKKAGNIVYDSQPRVISNLIVDQTSSNPAAVAAAEFPVRSQGNKGVIACSDPPAATDPADCIPPHQTLFIPNVTTDVGLSPPYNSWFTFFGQFFDHGVDQTVKSGGTVFVPLHDDDPLVAGPDHIFGNTDDLPVSKRFMPLTRAQNQPGPDGVLGTADDIQDANNTDTPWVDQSQTYTSHPAHQVFLREYAVVGGRPQSTGKFLGGLPADQTYPGSPDGTDGISTWASVKRQAALTLGLLLQDKDVTNIPQLLTDPYGNFVPGPARGLPQYVTATGLVEGCRATDAPTCTGPVPVPANVRHFDTPFLTDIAHNADPSPVDTNNDGVPDTSPVPDDDSTPSADFANQPAGTYDDEMLNAHFACGDGRCNENIALSTVHQVFHSEHNRLVDDITATLNANPTLLAAYRASHLVNGRETSFGLGGRLFQAARFVTEMEYQHLVFEEFARKVQPAVRAFHVYSTEINPAVEAEFAHAVYRFGHSMLDDDVARKNADNTDNSLPLLTAFLNPPEFFNNHGATYNPQQAAGAVVMGSVDQAGNELDEFVTETLRNNLLGLPLDLPSINMARARDALIPPLNDVRRQIFADTNDGQLAPYTSWSDFGQHLKHPESLINFVASYGTHPTITAQTTVAGKRAAARAIVDPLPSDNQPCDAAAFMFGTNGVDANCATGSDWSSGANGVTITGLDDVDLWVGGLAEVTNVFGGLLGSTFNYVFQTQLEKLQDGDRLYYLNRTPGLNLRTQLEGNSFAEMIQRNTDNTNTLKADVFATADCKFQLGNLTSPAPTGSAIIGQGSIADDLSTPGCNENLLLLKQPNGTIQYRSRNSVDPAGINGQAVYQGTNAADRMFGGNDNDTFWGGTGNDVIEGNGGDDVTFGGAGNDIITDLDGADVQLGGPGNDYIDGGPGADLGIGNAGQDFINGGSQDNEQFAGEGTDFINAGQGADAAFGDGGDDWIQGGSGQDLLQGDHGAPFFDDPGETAPGNDIFVGQVGENDYDAEGGDDLMAQNAAVDRNAGAGGFDWAFHQYDTVGADDDMAINNNLIGVPVQVVVNRDRWQETEGDSGSAFNDVIRGTDDAPSGVGGAGFIGCDALDPAGIARISGLQAILPLTLPTQLSAVDAISVTGRCPLTGQGASAPGVTPVVRGTVWAEGEILLGGAGSDSITGRGADDVIDGDRALQARIVVRAGVDANGLPTGAEIATTDLMEGKALTGNFGGPTTPTTPAMTLQQAVVSGIVDPGQLSLSRSLVNNAAATDIDTAVFLNARNTYTITPNTNGSITVDNNGGTDGIDTVWNIERLQFSDVTLNVRPTATLSATSLAFGNQNVASTSAARNVTITNTGLTPLVVSGVTLTGTGASQFTVISNCATVNSGATCTVATRFAPTAAGSAVAAVSIASNDAASPATINVTGTGVTPPVLPSVPPGTPTVVALANRTFTVTWTASATGGPFTRYDVRPIVGNVFPPLVVPVGSAHPTANGTTLTLTFRDAALLPIGGVTYRFQVRAVNANGASTYGTPSAAVASRP